MKSEKYTKEKGEDLMLIKDIILLVLGIIFLIKGADYFVDSGSKIGKTLKISEIIGLYNSFGCICKQSTGFTEDP